MIPVIVPIATAMTEMTSAVTFSEIFNGEKQTYISLIRAIPSFSHDVVYRPADMANNDTWQNLRPVCSARGSSNIVTAKEIVSHMQ